MKRNLFLFSFLAIFFYSCEEDMLVPSNNETPINEQSLTKEDELSNIKAMEDYNFSLFGTKDSKIIQMNTTSADDVLKEINKRLGTKYRRGGNFISFTQNPYIQGPFYVTANKIRNFEDKKVYYKGYGIPYGVYLADVYSYPITIDVPKDVDIVLLDKDNPADHVGYANYNQQQPGAPNNMINKGNGEMQFTATTMILEIKYDLSGRRINRYVPFNADKVTYKYYFVKLPNFPF